MVELGDPDAVAVDVGCGTGVLLCYLAQHFGRVIAIDRDPEILDAAEELVGKLREQGAELGEIEFRREDWAECEDIQGADLVCAVNAILEPDAERRFQMLRRLRKALDTGPRPTLLAIFPAMEAQVHLLRLYVAELARLRIPEETIRRKIDEEFLTAHHFDALAGTFSSRDEPTQKFYYELELAFELDDAGFTVEEMSRVLYPWEVCRAVDAGYFPGEIELFDWFVRARPTSFTI